MQEQIFNEQTESTSQPAAAEQTQGETEGKVSLGKFKDVAALLDAYNSLQSEFTKRCQKVKELEGKLEAVDKEKTPTGTDSREKSEEVKLEEKETFLKEYLKEVLGKKQTAIVMGGTGVGVKTPVQRPKTLEEAGRLAQELLNNN